MPHQVPFNTKDPAVIKIVQQVQPFEDLSENELQILSQILKKYKYGANEIVVQEGEKGSSAYIVAKGEFSLDIMDRNVKSFKTGDFFGEIALVDARPRMGTVRALGESFLYILDGKDLDDEKIIPATVAKKVYRGFARQISSYVREGSTLYDSIDVLLVQDGGCAPGYNPVTAFIAEYLSKSDRAVYIAAEGFRSIVSNRTKDYRYLIYDPDIYRQLEHIPGVLFSPPLRDARGANFRSERYPEFKNLKIQKLAAENIIKRKVKVIIGIGGNGTFYGMDAMSKLLPKNIQTFFIPVTIDSDIYGTECIGEYTGVEVGSEKIRSYMADARTHQRFYIIEMMGAHGGYHALHSCLGAGAHLAVLPSSNYNLKKVIKALKKRKDVVIVVAEGYKVKERKRIKYNGNAAEFFRDELLKAGLDIKQRIICEGWSRDIRGAAPNNMDIMLAQRMARKVSQFVVDGKNRRMPSVLSGKEGSISFDKITTDNSVRSELASLATRLLGE